MELLFVTLFGALLGVAARFLLPHRILHGSVLVPAVGAAVAAVVWVALTWAGLAWDGGLIWVITLLVAAAASVAVAAVVGRSRARHDHASLEKMLSGRPAAVASTGRSPARD